MTVGKKKNGINRNKCIRLRERKNRNSSFSYLEIEIVLFIEKEMK